MPMWSKALLFGFIFYEILLKSVPLVNKCNNAFRSVYEIEIHPRL